MAGEVERAEERIRVLTNAMRAFAEATTNLDQLLELVARNVAEVLGDCCVLLELTSDGTSLAPVAAHAVDGFALDRVKALIAEEPFLLETHPVARSVLDSRTALLVPRVNPMALRSQTTSAYVAFQRDLGVHSLLAVALYAQGRGIGLLTLTRYRASSPAFDESDKQLAQNLADHASLAIANARLYVAERNARIAAEEATTRLARLSGAGILGIVSARLDGRIIDVNPYIEAMLGYTKGELVSGAVPWSSLTPPEWAHVDTRAIAQIRATGIAELREKEFLRANGTRVPVLVGSAAVGEEAISFLLDLTERKRVEASLERLRAVIESAPDAIVVTDARKCITMVNNEAERVFGWKRDELMSAPLSMVVAGPETARRKDGGVVPIEVTESTLETNEGRLVIHSLRDTTERKRAEAELVRAKETAERANHELEAFSYSVAHDLRAPLRGIDGFAQILVDEHAPALGNDGAALLGRITASASRMGALIDGLLRLSRVTRTQLSRERVNLSEMASVAIQQAIVDAGAGPIDVVVEEDLWVDVDASLLRSLIDNLASNAVKFTARTAKPRIELGLVESEGERVFFLCDNGAGFDMAFSDKLFAPFQRLHSSNTYAGTGIGLATAQRIVHRHGGRIWAEGHVNEGATIYFTLPA